MTATKTVASLAPRDRVYTDSTNFVATHVGRAIGDNRATASIESTATQMLAERGVTLTAADATRITQLIMADTVYDSEQAMATRAVRTVLTETFGDSMQITGWLDGRQVMSGFSRVTLTDEACPRCEVNPLYCGAGGGVACLNSTECGYSFCY